MKGTLRVRSESRKISLLAPVSYFWSLSIVLAERRFVKSLKHGAEKSAGTPQPPSPGILYAYEDT